MVTENEVILFRLLLAVAAGGVIGFERTYHGRPAGFRTHTLVCTGSALLMLFAVYAGRLLAHTPQEILHIDPTRMAQGIMTGIGFLGAGVIMKEALSIRGLTTAASIWLTAAIGIMFGAGFYFPAVLGVLLALGTLAAFRWVESVMPSLSYGQLTIRCLRPQRLAEDELRALVQAHGISMTRPSYRLLEGGQVFEYQTTMRTGRRDNYGRLAEALAEHPRIQEFAVTPTGD